MLGSDGMLLGFHNERNERGPSHNNSHLKPHENNKQLCGTSVAKFTQKQLNQRCVGYSHSETMLFQQVQFLNLYWFLRPNVRRALNPVPILLLSFNLHLHDQEFCLSEMLKQVPLSTLNPRHQPTSSFLWRPPSWLWW